MNRLTLHRLLLWAVLLIFAASVPAADVMPYNLTLKPTGNQVMDQALLDASLLASLREEAQAMAERSEAIWFLIVMTSGWLSVRPRARIPASFTLVRRDPAPCSTWAGKWSCKWRASNSPMCRTNLVHRRSLQPSPAKPNSALAP